MNRTQTLTTSLQLPAAGQTPLALYVHWPFCVSKCPYCDFNSHVREQVDEAAWRDALLADLAHEAALTPGRRLGSIFFGGGTPSLMQPATVEAILNKSSNHWQFSDNIEITLEANPNSVEAARFADLGRVGVNRVSLGLQALDDAALRFLGRAHGLAEGLAGLDKAQAAFDRVSFDLIYARPDQSEIAWEKELQQALSFGTSHLSLYQLTIEPGTRFETLVRQGAFTPLDPDRAADFYDISWALSESAGLPAYEISNHARPGQESRHNLTYWRYGDYVGVGPGAHGRRGGLATVRHKKPENWMQAVTRNGHGLQTETELSPAEQATEALMMGLRLSEGVDLLQITRRTGLTASEIVDEPALARLETLGLITRHDDRLAILPEGRLLLDAILPEILSARLLATPNSL